MFSLPFALSSLTANQTEPHYSRVRNTESCRRRMPSSAAGMQTNRLVNPRTMELRDAGLSFSLTKRGQRDLQVQQYLTVEPHALVLFCGDACS